MKNNNKQRGFTLIELVMVIVILGVLAAVSLPKFVDISDEAKTASTQAMAAAISSGSAANLAARKVGSPSAAQVNAANICTAVALSPLIQGGISDSYQIGNTLGSENRNCSGTADTATCSLYYSQEFDYQATIVQDFTVYCAR